MKQKETLVLIANLVECVDSQRQPHNDKTLETSNPSEGPQVEEEGGHLDSTKRCITRPDYCIDYKSHGEDTAIYTHGPTNAHSTHVGPWTLWTHVCLL